jgi:integrase
MHFRAHFCSRWQRLEQVTGKAIEKYKVDRQAEDNGRGGLVGLTTTYKELVTLSRFLRWCKRQGHLVEVPEFDRFRPVSNYRPPDLTAEVVRTLLAELPDQKTHHNRRPVREFFTVQWAQAMRPGEVMTLTWQDVDLERKRVTVRAANDKARAGRTIGLADEAYQTLKTLAKAPHLTTARIFDRCDYRVSLRLAGVKVGLPDVTPHHLRHARLSEMASVTRDVAAVQYMAGHKNLSTTDRYVRSRTERTEGLIKALSDIVSMPRSKKRKRAKS